MKVGTVGKITILTSVNNIPNDNIRKGKLIMGVGIMAREKRGGYNY